MFIIIEHTLKQGLCPRTPVLDSITRPRQRSMWLKYHTLSVERTDGRAEPAHAHRQLNHQWGNEMADLEVGTYDLQRGSGVPKRVNAPQEIENEVWLFRHTYTLRGGRGPPPRSPRKWRTWPAPGPDSPGLACVLHHV